ncbi:porin family protein, partial [Phocaeicola vulgatus]|uniref:porin family protein n=1 Tax=Phocaeicola vulgatus TaxID=821 RepID=UPI0034A5C5DE
MKKYKNFGLLVLALLFALPAAAQLGEERHNFAVGINGGLNMSSVSFNPKIKLNTLNTMSMGVTMRYMSEKYFKMMCGVQMEINYSQRGWDEKIEDDSGNSYSRTMNYLEIPFMAHLAFGKDRGLQFFIHAGPQIGFLLGDSEKIDGDWDGTVAESYTNITVEQHGKAIDNKFDYGIAGGAGIE